MKLLPEELNNVDIRLFEAMPGNSLLLRPDSPQYTIIAVTGDYCRTAGKLRQELMGKGLFEAFPNSPGDPGLTGEKALRASLEHTLLHKESHHLPVHRFDVVKPDGTFDERYWTALNKPILDDNGKVIYLIHNTEDVTGQVMTRLTLEVNRGMEKAYNLFMNAPVIVGILKGDEYRIELANAGLLEVWGRTAEVIGQPLLKAIPELEEQGIIPLLDHVRATGEPFYAYEFPLTLNRHGKEEVVYFDFVYKAIFENETEKKASGVISVGHDVTAQVTARQKVQESEAKYRNLFESMNQGFCVLEMIFDADSRPIDYCFLEINPVFEKQTGLKDAVGKTALELVPNLEKHWLDLYGNVALTGQSTNFTEGSAAMGRWFEVNAFRAGDENSRKVALLFTDISERKNNEEILKQSEATLQKSVAERTAQLEEQKRLIGSILEASLDGIYALKAIRNADGKITDFQYLFANHNTAALLNRKADEVIGSSMLELIPENRTNGFFDTFCNILETGNILRGETHFITNDIDGWYDYVIVPIDSETVVVTTEDITDKKLAFIQMEEQRNLLDNILKNSSNGISVSQVFRDETGKVVDALTILANDAAVKYIGLPKDIYLSKRATEIEPEIIGSPYYQNCIKTLETGEPFVMQYQMHATGRWLELTVSRLDYHHLIQIFTDVTPIKETQLQLEKSVEDLKRSNQNLEEFAYAASHDLKEPMRKIQLFSDRLKERLHDKLSGEETGFFDRIMNATHRMNALIEDLLLYSHVSRGVMKEDSVDLNQKVKMVLEDLELEIEEKNAVIMVHPLPTVKGHRRQLQQLFQNLIGNAIKYSRKGIAPAVNITSRQVHPQDSILVSRPTKEKKDHYLIEVADNGIGFEQDDAERIFNVFTRLHGMAEYKGTGVGLSIARKVVENHGGLIWAESKPGEGSTFKILLPAE